jgi:ABC-2 type transport system ATP-binding protein
MIKIESLQKRYGTDVVLQITELAIARGQTFGLVGNNGAGKTTLFRIMLDLVRPTQGKVLLEGKDVSTTEEWKNRVGSYLDEHMLLSYLTPDEYFETLRKIYGLSREDLQLHLERFGDIFNGEIRDQEKYIRDLSKGNLKKVGIAAAMLGYPELVILDEPFENIDPSSQIKLKKLIQHEKEERNTTFLISSHDLTHVTDICQRVVLLEKGRIARDLTGDKQKMAGELDEYFAA